MAGRLAVSMLAVQLAIGALNDAVDWQRDAVAKPAKPIPSGLVSRRAAIVGAAVLGAVGLALSAVSGPATLAAIAWALGMGVLYDLRLSRGRWSWLPFALALPVVPVHAWLGATGSIPPGLLGLAPTAVLAGAMLALANGLVDLERDARSHRPTVAVRLGRGRAWAVHAVLLAAVALLALVLAPDPGRVGVPGPAGPPPAVPAPAVPAPAVPADVLGALRRWAVPLGMAALGVGALALAARRPLIRERGWELEAVGVAAAGIGWLAGTAAAGVG